MSLVKKYAAAMRKGNTELCVDIEEDNDLSGLPPELVTIGLKALDDGLDAWEEIDKYAQASEQH